jgi:hypothetical protein
MYIVCKIMVDHLIRHKGINTMDPVGLMWFTWWVQIMIKRTNPSDN